MKKRIYIVVQLDDGTETTTKVVADVFGRFALMPSVDAIHSTGDLEYKPTWDIIYVPSGTCVDRIKASMDGAKSQMRNWHYAYSEYMSAEEAALALGVPEVQFTELWHLADYLDAPIVEGLIPRVPPPEPLEWVQEFT